MNSLTVIVLMMQLLHGAVESHTIVSSPDQCESDKDKIITYEATHNPSLVMIGAQCETIPVWRST